MATSKIRSVGGKTHWTWKQGSTATMNLTIKDGAGVAVDITGRTFTLLVAKTFGGTAVLTLTSPSGGITIVDAAAGQIQIKVSDENTAAQTWNRGVFDLDMDNSGEVETIVSGVVFVEKQI
mgnify:CR=1 FL=1